MLNAYDEINIQNKLENEGSNSFILTCSRHGGGQGLRLRTMHNSSLFLHVLTSSSVHILT